jgi:porphobilinogen synthase
VFILDGANQRQQVGSMPGVERVSVDLLPEVAAECVAAGHPGAGAVPGDRREAQDAGRREAANPDGLVPRAVRR